MILTIINEETGEKKTVRDVRKLVCTFSLFEDVFFDIETSDPEFSEGKATFSSESTFEITPEPADGNRLCYYELRKDIPFDPDAIDYYGDDQDEINSRWDCIFREETETKISSASFTADVDYIIHLTLPKGKKQTLTPDPMEVSFAFAR